MEATSALEATFPTPEMIATQYLKPTETGWAIGQEVTAIQEEHLGIHLQSTLQLLELKKLKCGKKKELTK